jgi:uncharacterized protein YjlB
VDGIYPFHHFHSTAHEVLGIVAGSAVVVLGGPSGRCFQVHRGENRLRGPGASSGDGLSTAVGSVKPHHPVGFEGATGVERERLCPPQ